MRRHARPVISPEALVPDFLSYLDLREAILRHDFSLEYQPVVDLRAGLIERLEALVRWQHRRLGRLPPEAFLPQMERARLMQRLTRLVLNDALDQCARFHREGILVGVAVNISPSAVTDDLPGQVRDALARHRLNGTWLTLELTQAVGFRDPDRAATLLALIRTEGVGISLDDFGAPHASLSDLQSLVLSEIKIDRSFFQRARKSSRNAEVVRFATQSARRLGLRVVAKGIENARLLPLLQALRVDAAQGRHFAPPLSGEGLLTSFRDVSAQASARAAGRFGSR